MKCALLDPCVFAVTEYGIFRTHTLLVFMSSKVIIIILRGFDICVTGDIAYFVRVLV